MKRLLLLFTLVFSIVANAQLNIHPDLLPHLNEKLAPFYHGVASGDPTAESVIIWTKVTLDKKEKKALILWEVAEDASFESIVAHGKKTVTAASDFSLKIDVSGLDPGRDYFYRFHYKDKVSLVGETRTLPKDASEISIAFAACSNYEWGYFNNYRFIAEDKDIDLVVHLGDYIYEYAIGVYGDTSIGRINVPAGEILTLSDYRTRYSLYRLDPDLMRAHQMKPFVTTWDDHEIANNAYDEGAQNHQEGEGDWHIRASAARKAYYEWLPVRKQKSEPLYRSFSIGTLADLIILDTRLEGRTEQVEDMLAPNFQDSSRTILGKQQYDWLIDELNGKQEWKIIGNQVPFGPLYFPGDQRGEKYMDGWDGYPYEQRRLMHELESKENVVFVTGDYHRSFALENDLEGTADESDNVSVEFVVTSITSANADEYMSKEDALAENESYLTNNPHMNYANSTGHGYLVLHISQEKVVADFVYASTVRSQDAEKRTERSVTVNRGVKVLK